MGVRRNSDGTPTEQAIKADGAIPYASQIHNDSSYPGDNVDDALDTLYTTVGARQMVKVTGLAMETLNNEQSTAIGGSAANQFTPTHVVFHVEDVGAGAAAAGNVHVSIGIASGGTQILTETTLTGLNTINERYVVDLTGSAKAAIPANSTIYVKNLSADTTAGAGHKMDAYIFGEVFAGG